MDQHEEIKKVAYELYEKSGRIGGREIENWLAAEKIVMARKAQHESGIKAGAAGMAKKTAVKAKVQKSKTKDTEPKGIESGKAGAKKTASRKTKKAK